MYAFNSIDINGKCKEQISNAQKIIRTITNIASKILAGSLSFPTSKCYK